MKNRDRKRVSEVGWMPFWWGNKFIKRLASKRVRQHEKEELKKKYTEGKDNARSDIQNI